MVIHRIHAADRVVCGALHGDRRLVSWGPHGSQLPVVTWLRIWGKALTMKFVRNNKWLTSWE